MRSSFLVDFFPAHILRRLFPGYRAAPPARIQRFHLRNIYILPGRAGLGLIGIVLLTLLAAINFQNSLIYMVSFWLAGLLLIHVMYSFRNLNGLQIELLGVEPCFAGQRCQVSLKARGQRNKESIYIGWKTQQHSLIDLCDSDSQVVSVSYPTLKRGWLTPPRLEVSSRFPAGLIRAWGYAHLDIQALVYPAPHFIADSKRNSPTGGLAEDGNQLRAGVSDFSGMRAYQPGDSPRRIHWAKYAQTGKVYSKEFVDYEQHDVWLDWADLVSGTIEQRLSHLCARVLDLSAQQQGFGLRIPGSTLQPGQGDAHRAACLSALALYSEAS